MAVLSRASNRNTAIKPLLETNLTRRCLAAESLGIILGISAHREAPNEIMVLLCYAL